MRPVTVSSLAAVLLALATGACMLCPPAVLEEVRSPGADYTAASYRSECGGAVGSVTTGVKLRSSTTEAWSEVLTIEELAYETKVIWDAPKRLRVTVECRFDAADSCAPAHEGRWNIVAKAKWNTVGIVYELGPNLQRWAIPEIRAALKN